MPETVYRFMDARMLMNLVAGNWASFETDIESDEPVESDGLLAVDIPLVRFASLLDADCVQARCRGGIVHLDIEPLAEGEDYRREGGDVYVMADVLVGEPVNIEFKP
ncbi:MAG: hypothetical protein ACLFU7_05480 [Armatimonadota bacterium]